MQAKLFWLKQNTSFHPGKKKKSLIFFDVKFWVDLKSVICDSAIHTDLTESLN